MARTEHSRLAAFFTPKSRGKHELQRKGFVLDVGFMRPHLVWRGYWIDGDNVMSKETGGQAFPFTPHIESKNTEELGMSLRDYFAAKAMQAIVRRYDGHSFGGGSESPQYKELSDDAYCIADAMLKARNQ
ncbi:hypothetical protein ACUNI2_26880 [Serratia sp. IR-2025]